MWEPVFQICFTCFQVHLEMSPNSQNGQSEHFDELKVSNARRYEVLKEILTSLGLSCDLNQSPAPSPVQLLATSQVRAIILLERQSIKSSVLLEYCQHISRQKL